MWTGTEPICVDDGMSTIQHKILTGGNFDELSTICHLQNLHT